MLSDIIESCGGSTELITILKDLVLLRQLRHLNAPSFQFHRIGKQLELRAYKAFTVASAYNVDFLQSNAAVYAGNQHRSWHATSIKQCQKQLYIVHRAYPEDCLPQWVKYPVVIALKVVH